MGGDGEEIGGRWGGDERGWREVGWREVHVGSDSPPLS